MKAVKCSPSTFAKTMKTSAKPPLVIHIFSPVSANPPSGQSGGACGRAERIRSRARLAERVRADQLAGDQPRQISGFLIGCAEVQDRADREIALRAEGGAERRAAGQVWLLTTSAAALSSPTPPNSSGASTPSRPSSPARCSSWRAKRPVLLLEAIDARDDFLVAQTRAPSAR